MKNLFMKMISKINWDYFRKTLTGRTHNLTLSDKYKIYNQLKNSNYIIGTYKKSHASTWAVRIANFFLTGKWGKLGHIFVNINHGGSISVFDDLSFIEAIGKGVVVSTFDDVFNVDGVCILKPRWYTPQDLEKGIPEVVDEIGKKYDQDLDVNSETTRACVEIGRELLYHLPDYKQKMRVFEYMIQSKKYLTPDMFRECPDFEVVLEIYR